MWDEDQDLVIQTKGYKKGQGQMDIGGDKDRTET